MQKNFRALALAVVVAASVHAAGAHAQTVYDTATFVSRADAAFGYQYIRSNAPPNGEPTFSAQGAFGEVHASVWHYIGVAGEVTGTHANNISTLGQNLTLLTYAAGPRATLQGNRFSLFAQALLGAAHGSDSYFPTATGYTTSANSFAYSGGGGVDYSVTHRWAVRGEVQYLHTAFPNGVNDSQQHLMLGVGLVYRIGGRYSHPEGRRRTKLVAAEPEVQPMAQPQASQPLPAATPAASAMDLTPIVPAVPAPAPMEERSRPEFRANVKHVHFDPGNSGLSVHALSELAHAAVYLRQHSEERVIIGSFSDANGGVDKATLTERRVNAVREALIASGVSSDRIVVASSSVTSCTDANRGCVEQSDVITLNDQP